MIKKELEIGGSDVHGQQKRRLDDREAQRIMLIIGECHTAARIYVKKVENFTKWIRKSSKKRKWKEVTMWMECGRVMWMT